MSCDIPHSLVMTVQVHWNSTCLQQGYNATSWLRKKLVRGRCIVDHTDYIHVELDIAKILRKNTKSDHKCCDM